MKKLLKTTLMLALTVLTVSCASSRKILYLQDIDKNPVLQALHQHKPAIKSGDQLRIAVTAPNPDVAAPYNQDGAPVSLYRVDDEGYINFPVLGRMAVSGKTTDELAQTLKEWIAVDVRDPVVEVRFSDYRVTILGEVRSPGTYTLPGDGTTIFQALGMAGDLTIAGKRNNVLVLRLVEGRYQYATLDLRKADILSSPYYSLDRDDLLYVAPNTARISSGTAPMTIISMLFSSASFIMTLIMFLL